MAAQLIRTWTGTSQKSQEHPDNINRGQTPLTRTTTTNTQTGVLNHLTQAQEGKLDEFKGRLQKDGWWSPDAVNGKPTHDDGTLLRYLRARKFDVEGAIGQFTDTEKWMKEQHVEELYEHFDVEFFEKARTLYPQWTGHRDKRGIPIYVYEIKGLDSKAVDKYQKESAKYKEKSPNHKKLSTPAKMLPLFALYHNLLNFVLPLCSSLERPRPEIPVTNSTNIVDISGVSLRQFWNLKAHMQDASVLATAHYPETLDRIFIIGAPAFFPTVWGWVKRWFDPVTVSKIFILAKHEVTPTLQSYMDPTSIPKKYGGKLDWVWGDVPDLDDEIREALERDGKKGWVKGPALWLNNERIVVGSVNGKPRRSDKEIAEMKPIVYAADYTEEPVHPNKRASIVGDHRKSLAAVNGRSSSDKPRSDSPSTLVEGEAAAAATAAAAAGTATATTATATTTTAPSSGPVTSTALPVEEEPEPSTPKPGVPAHIAAENIRTSPMGDSQVHLPDAQPAPPSTTAEYISPSPSKQHVPAATADPVVDVAKKESSPLNVTAAVPSASVQSPADSAVASPHPAGHTQPGPLSSHQAEVNRKIADQLNNESTILIPAEANGLLPHPAIIASSDKTKGLAIEEDKMALNGNLARPQPERFVTAAEF